VTSLIEQLIDARRRLLEAAEAVPPERRDEAFLGSWCAKDILAHLVGWDYTNVEAIAEMLADRLPAFYGQYDPDWAAVNAGLVQRYRVDDWQALVDAARRWSATVTSLLSGLPEEELVRDRGLRWRGHVITIAALLRAALRDEFQHAEQLRAFARSLSLEGEG